MPRAAWGGTLISEQPEEQHKAQGYPDYRFTHSLRKMFLPNLLALLQRLSLQVFSGEAIEVIDANREKPDEAHIKMELLRTTLMDFTLRFQPDLLTNEDNGTNIYRHAQKVLGVHDTQQRLHRALADVDSQRIARHQDKVQHNIHWLELFIFTVYVVELTSHLSHAFSGHNEPSWFTGWGLVIAIAVAMVAAAIQLKLPLLHKHPVRDGDALKGSWRARFNQFEKRWLIMALIGLAIGTIIYIDKRITATESKEAKTSAPPNAHSSAAPHSNSPVEIATPRVSLQLDPALEPLQIRVSPADPKAAIESPAHLPPAESEHK